MEAQVPDPYPHLQSPNAENDEDGACGGAAGTPGPSSFAGLLASLCTTPTTMYVASMLHPHWSLFGPLNTSTKVPALREATCLLLSLNPL